MKGVVISKKKLAVLVNLWNSSTLTNNEYYTFYVCLLWFDWCDFISFDFIHYLLLFLLYFCIYFLARYESMIDFYAR